MVTGTLPTLNGMHDFSGNKLGPNQTTPAAVFKEAGSATGAVIGSAVLDSRFSLNRGFDFYYDHVISVAYCNRTSTRWNALAT